MEQEETEKCGRKAGSGKRIERLLGWEVTLTKMETTR
jgi:hypothetical protein